MTSETVVDHSRGLCGEPDYSANDVLDLLKYPAHCLCCGAEMKIERHVNLLAQLFGIFMVVCPVCQPRPPAAA